MADNDAILSGLLTPTKYATPEQRRRAQQHAYALMQQPDEKYTSWTQGARDVVNALVGRHIINQTSSQEAEQLNQGGQAQASLLDEIQRRAKSQSAPPPAAPQATAPTPAPVTTGSLSPEAAGGIAGVAAQGLSSGATPEGSIGATGNQSENPKTGYKLDEYLKRLFEVESNNNPEARKGSYRGLAQFSPDLEKKYGINDANWKDPTTQIRAAAQHTVESAKAYQDKFGHAPTNGELYLMHQQGVNGGTSILGGEPNAPAWKTIKEAARVSDDEAKRRIMGNIPTGSSLSKKPVDQITNQEFGRLWTGKFDSEQSKYKPMMLGGPKEGDTVTEGPQGQQVAQANGIPPAVTAPSAAVDKDNLAKLLANPTIPPEMKSKIQEMMIQGATPANRETAQGMQQYRPSSPEETSTPGATGTSTIHAGGAEIPVVNTRMPDGSMKSQFLLPGGKLTDMEGLTEWGRQQKAEDERTVGTATKATAEYEDQYKGLQHIASKAVDQIPLIQTMKELAKDPTFYSGVGDEKILNMRKLLAAAGIDPGNASPTEVFKKLSSGAVIEGLEQFRGLGQIRVAEINQLEKSLANTTMSASAIQSVLGLSEKVHQRYIDMANLASEYAASHKDRLDRGWDKHLRDWQKDHPLMTKEEIANFRESTKVPSRLPREEESKKPTGRTYNQSTGKFE